MLLYAIINCNLHVSHSTRFLPFLSDSEVSAKFKVFSRPQSRDSIRDVLVSGWFLRCTLHLVAAHFCRIYCVPLPDFKTEKWDQSWFQNRPAEFKVVGLDRFCCSIARMIAVQNLCAVLLSHSFWPLRAIINCILNLWMYPILLVSCPFCIPTLLKMEFEGGESYWNFILKFNFCNHVFSMINIPHHSMCTCQTEAAHV